MKALLNGIMDPYIYNSGDFMTLNQVTFFTSVFPLYFLNAPENQQILKVNKSNSSRISNLFTRQSDPKRRESRFRDRFLKSFDTYFFDEMLISSRYLLRNYKKEAFEAWVSELLLDDVDLKSDENMFFYNQIAENFKNKPHLALTLITIWAFHIDDFGTIIDVIKSNGSLSSNQTDSENGEYSHLIKLISDYNLDPADVSDFIDIAYKYGICSGLGAVAIKTYVDTNTKNNPLITAELADMYFYGNNFTKQYPEKAMNLYTINANMDYGSALWSIGQISSNERFNMDLTPVQMSLHYYERAIQSNHALSYNNIGKWWLYALHYHLDRVVKLPGYRNIFVNQGRQAISDIYQVMSARHDFNSFIDQYDLNRSIEFLSLTDKQKEDLISRVENAETYICDVFVLEAFKKQKYFHSLGTSAALYEYQYERRIDFHEKYGLIKNVKREEDAYQKYEYYVKEYAKFQSSNAQYAYVNYLKKTHANAQDIYEYLYKTVFETPGNTINYEALLEFLAYHVNPRVVYKKKHMDFESLLLEAAKNYQPNIQSKSKHMYKAVELMLLHFKTPYIEGADHDTIIELLKAESVAHPEEYDAYQTLLQTFIETIKISRRY